MRTFCRSKECKTRGEYLKLSDFVGSKFKFVLMVIPKCIMLAIGLCSYSCFVPILASLLSVI